MLPALVLMEKAKSVDGSAGLPCPAKGPSATLPLQQLGDYQILRVVGRGGMGIVYEAQQLSLGRHVAIKVLPAHALLDPRHLGRFQREARSAAKLHHTNIVPVFGVGEQDGLHYYVMQFIQGLGLDLVLGELNRLRQPHGKHAPTLGGATGRHTDPSRDGTAAGVARSMCSGEFRRPDPARPLTTAVDEANSVASPPTTRAADTSSVIHLPGQTEASSLSQSGSQYWQSVARVGMQVADALAHAASQGILHRDIKPSNLLLDDTGNVWVTDFGLAKATNDGDNLTHTGDIVGTLRYMAPEDRKGIMDSSQSRRWRMGPHRSRGANGSWRNSPSAKRPTHRGRIATRRCASCSCICAAHYSCGRVGPRKPWRNCATPRPSMRWTTSSPTVCFSPSPNTASATRTRRRPPRPRRGPRRRDSSRIAPGTGPKSNC